MNSGILAVRRTERAMNIDHVSMRFSKEERPTRATIEAMEETVNDMRNGNIKVFYDTDDFMNDLLAD